MTRNLFVTLLFVMLSSSVMPAGAQPDAGVQSLERILSEARTVQASFEQLLLDDKLQVIKESRGKVALQRPAKFRWDYLTPNAQTIVSDGRRLWIHDPELEQVTVKPLDGALATSPAALLGGQGKLAENFRISDLGTTNGLHWFELAPKVKDTEFEQVRLGLGTKFIEVMELTDGFGQITRITLRETKVNPTLPKGLFEFVPPPGADVVGDEDGEK